MAAAHKTTTCTPATQLRQLPVPGCSASPPAISYCPCRTFSTRVDGCGIPTRSAYVLPSLLEPHHELQLKGIACSSAIRLLSATMMSFSSSRPKELVLQQTLTCSHCPGPSIPPRACQGIPRQPSISVLAAMYWVPYMLYLSPHCRTLCLAPAQEANSGIAQRMAWLGATI